MLVNLLVILLVVILSFVFKLSETKKYDSQLIFIILSFTVLILYKCISQYNNKCNRDEFVNADINDFINNTDNLTEELAKYKNLVAQYENKYDINYNNINENDINNLEKQLDVLTQNVYRDINRDTPDNYITIENSEPSVEDTVEGQSTETQIERPSTLSADTVFNALQQILRNNTEITIN